MSRKQIFRNCFTDYSIPISPKFRFMISDVFNDPAIIDTIAIYISIRRAISYFESCIYVFSFFLEVVKWVNHINCLAYMEHLVNHHRVRSVMLNRLISLD